MSTLTIAPEAATFTSEGLSFGAIVGGTDLQEMIDQLNSASPGIASGNQRQPMGEASEGVDKVPNIAATTIDPNSRDTQLS